MGLDEGHFSGEKIFSNSKGKKMIVEITMSPPKIDW